jgi:hypothetical protein
MKTDTVQPLNYLAHALEDLRRLQKDLSATALACTCDGDA